MHEFKLIHNIFSTVIDFARNNALHSVNKVTLQVGRLRQLAPEFLRFAFAVIGKDTIIDGAHLEIEHVPVSFMCRDCSKQFTVDDDVYVCPECQSSNLEFLSGKEIILVSIEGER